MVFVKVLDTQRFGKNGGTDINGLAASVGQLAQRWAVASVLLERRGFGYRVHGKQEIEKENNEPVCWDGRMT
jgi:hypothetical protein